jgi:hypothetical protein
MQNTPNPFKGVDRTGSTIGNYPLGDSNAGIEDNGSGIKFTPDPEDSKKKKY